MKSLRRMLILPLVGMAMPLSGCVYNLPITSLSVEKYDEFSFIRINIPESSVEYIKKGEYTVWVYLMECAKPSKGYVLETYAAGEKMNESVAWREKKFDHLLSKVTNERLKSYRNPCVKIDGGSYFMGKIASTSKVLPIRN